jgi:putative zinc finger/helix-turn-helix YgiT family protein
MLGICPNCEKETTLEFIKRDEEILVRNEPIKVNVEFYKCTECGVEFRDPKSSNDPLDLAYREYRSIHKMIMPEQIKAFRDQYNITQQELSNLLGWGGATVSRYENGALQDEAHDTVLRLIFEPRNFKDLLESRPGVISEAKRKKIIDLLIDATKGFERSFLRMHEDLFGKYSASIFSGFKELDITKLFNSIVFFCKDSDIPKTKLNKLLFYADFKHFKEYTVSITGAQYAHLPFGPAPDHYQYYLAALDNEEKNIRIEEKIFSDYVGEYLVATASPDLSSFTVSELKILTTVKEYFSKFNAKAISELSHKEAGYLSTKDGELISYEYATSLNI